MRHGPKIGLACLALATVAYGAITHWYARQWKDTATLFTHATSVTKSNFIAHTTAALAFVRNRDLPGAVPHFEAGLRINPGAVNFRYYYAQTLASLGRDEQAASQFEGVTARDPLQMGARFGLAAIQLRLGRSAEALANLRILKEHQFTAPDLDEMIEKAAARAQREQSPEGGLPRESNAQP
jgi:tetratricopeptide (TPR) repeat protein